MDKFFLTTPIYYVNARPHIGHVYTNIAADVLARYYRAKGREVLFSTGTDENSQKNVEAAEKAGKDVQGYVDEMAEEWKRIFTDLGFSFDTFIRTTAPEHVQAVQAFIERIDKAGDMYVGDYEGLYCVGCETFLKEDELVDGKCPIHKTVPQKITEKNYFFALSKYRQKLLDHFKDNPEFLQPSSARNKMLHYIEHEMEDVSISRQSQKWGIRLPQNDDHAVYVWFDALINYLTVTGFPDKKFEKFWPADLHLIGKDIIKFHCAIWPAMLLSAGLPLPKRVFAHGFFTVDGQKISKSLGNAIDPMTLAKEYPFDVIRYYVLRDIPFGNDGDFSHERLKERYNADLANGLGNLVSRTLNMIQQFGGDTFDADGAQLPAEVDATLSSVSAYIESLAFDKALESIWQAIAWADGLIEETKPWQLAKAGDTARVTGILQELYATLVAVNMHLAPFLPQTHEKLSAILSARPILKPPTPLFLRK
ncbi:MAG: methionine--tRNA ligase [Candidatus Andersenbacteria bacterium]|nr:methionine--tRNA ligase [Candidatus Andersenbacteria bacterium]MBI3250625.1 methionine--tRNA ligase [Candidatus Andersenbacteria bacterium]